MLTQWIILHLEQGAKGKLYRNTWYTFLIKYSTGMRYAIVLYVRLSVCLSLHLAACFHHNSRAIRRRMMRLCTTIVEVKSDIEFEDGSRTWPLTPSNWGSFLVNTCIHVLLQFIKYSTGMLYAIVLYVHLSVSLSVHVSACFHHNSRAIRRRMMKLGTYTLKVKSNMEF